MAQTTINVGSAANDGTGDPLRTAMQTSNSNFTELYTGLAHPGFRSGAYYHFPVGSFNNSAGVVLDTVYLVPFYVGHAVTLSGLGIRTATGSGNCKFGIYNNASGRPGTRNSQLSAAVSTASNNADVSGTFSANPTLAIGWYWLAVLPDNSTLTASAVGANDTSLSYYVGGSSIVSTEGLSGQATGWSYNTAGLYASGLPADLSALGSVNLGNCPLAVAIVA